jgi:hypothetical protein
MCTAELVLILVSFHAITYGQYELAAMASGTVIAMMVTDLMVMMRK